MENFRKSSIFKAMGCPQQSDNVWDVCEISGALCNNWENAREMYWGVSEWAIKVFVPRPKGVYQHQKMFVPTPITNLQMLEVWTEPPAD